MADPQTEVTLAGALSTLGFKQQEWTQTFYIPKPTPASLTQPETSLPPRVNVGAMPCPFMWLPNYSQCSRSASLALPRLMRVGKRPLFGTNWVSQLHLSPFSLCASTGPPRRG